MILFGCGGHARSIISIIRKMDENIEIILVDKNADANELIMNCKAVRQYILEKRDCYIIAVGDNVERRKLYRTLRNKGVGYCISVVAVDANIGIGVRIGEGTFVSGGTYIGPQADIGKNTIINTGSVIEHEVIVGDNTHIAPNVTICGRSKIGHNVFCGAGSTVIDKISICDNVVIGAGAVVRNSIWEEGTYVGVPARKIS